jgi:hypothetical protein
MKTEVKKFSFYGQVNSVCKIKEKNIKEAT